MLGRMKNAQFKKAGFELKHDRLAWQNRMHSSAREPEVAAVLAQIAAEYLLGNFQQAWTKALKAHKLSKTARFMEAEPQLKAALCTNVE